MLSKYLSHQGFLKYFKNSSWLLFEKFFRMGVGFLVIAWLAKYLGPSDFGTYNYIQGFVALFTGFSTLGLDTILVRELVKNNNKTNLLLGTVFVLRLVGAIIAIILIFSTVGFFPTSNEINFYIYIIAFSFIFQSFNVIDAYFQAHILSKYIVFVNIVGFLISSLIKLYLIYINAELFSFVIVILFDNFLLAMGFVYVFMYNNHSLRSWKFDLLLAKKLLGNSWPLIFSSTVLIIQARIDQVMLNSMIDASEVGYYSTALMIVEAVGFLAIILKQTLLPALINAKKVSQQLYEQRFLNLYRVSFLVFLTLASFLFLFGEEIILLFFGDAYQAAGILLSIYSIRLFFTYMGVARSSFIVVENLFKYSLFTMAMGSIVNVVLNYYLIPEYKAVGAIIATIASFTVTIFVFDAMYIKTRKNFLLMIKAMLTVHNIRILDVKNE